MKDDQKKDSLLGKEENESSRQGGEQSLLDLSQEQEEFEPHSGRVNSALKLLTFLNKAGVDVNVLCQQSRSLLESETSVNEPRSPQAIIQQLVKHEENNVTFLEKNHQRSKNRSNYGTLFLIIALALFGLGVILIPAMVSSVVIPFIPVFLLGIAIGALGRVFLKLHENYCDTEHQQAKSVLDGINAAALQKELEEFKDGPVNEDLLMDKVQEISKDVKDIKGIVLQSGSDDLAGYKSPFQSTTRAEVSVNGDTNTGLIDPVPGARCQ